MALLCQVRPLASPERGATARRGGRPFVPGKAVGLTRTPVWARSFGCLNVRRLVPPARLWQRGLHGRLWWGGPPGPRGSPGPAAGRRREGIAEVGALRRPTRGSAADLGVRPTRAGSLLKGGGFELADGAKRGKGYPFLNVESITCGQKAGRTARFAVSGPLACPDCGACSSVPCGDSSRT